MQRFVLEMPLEPGAAAECTAREWRLRSATGDLRRQGIRVRLVRVVRRPEGGLCLFVFEAASVHEATLAAELAELDRFRIVELGVPPEALNA